MSMGRFVVKLRAGIKEPGVLQGPEGPLTPAWWRRRTASSWTSGCSSLAASDHAFPYMGGGAGAHLSIACSMQDQVGGRVRFGGRNCKRGRQAARSDVAPAGANGYWVVSMCQMASARRRAMSTRATLLPRWRPRRPALRS